MLDAHFHIVSAEIASDLEQRIRIAEGGRPQSVPGFQEIRVPVCVPSR